MSGSSLVIKGGTLDKASLCPMSIHRENCLDDVVHLLHLVQEED
jgi:hypothetical protein